jgi:hypothetical protein
LRGSIIRAFGNAVVVLSFSLGACSGADKAPRADSTANPARPLAAAQGSRSLRSYPGALTKPIDSYSGDELYDFTQQLKYAGSHERERKCKGSPDCDGTAPKKTLVQVSAVATQDSLGASDVPPFGVVYVRAINRGDVEEARYGLRAGKDLRYFMIVHRDSAGALRWRLEELVTATPRRHTRIATGEFRGCGHADRWTPGARADFKTCEDAERADSVASLGLTLAGAAQATDDAPIWSACGSGCCLF